MKLPKNIIKKYGISKKAWSIYRARKGKTRTASAGGKVARRRKTTSKSRTRRVMSNQFTPAVGAFLYGAIREATLAKVMDPILSRVPLPGTQYTDEIAMFAGSWALSKGKIPFLNKLKITRSIGRAGMIIEASRVGQQMGARSVNNFVVQTTGGSPASATTSSGLLF